MANKKSSGETKKESSKKSKVSKMRKLSQKTNYWAISTAVLAILLIATMITGGTTGAIVSPEQAGQNVLSFAKTQGADATFVNASDNGSLYQIILSIKGKDGASQEVPVYVTKDGKTLVPQPISLEKKTTAPKETSKSTPTPANIPKSDKPVVEAFVMAYCPYGTQMEKGILPVVKALGDKINFEIKFVYYSMHTSHGEVKEQLNQYCIQKEQHDKYLDYLTCFLEAGDGKGCMDSVGIDKTKLETCTTTTDKKFNVMANLEDKSSWLSGRFPKFDIFKADNEKYGVKGSPTLIINGVTAQTGRDSVSLLNTICSSFNVAPEECNKKFEATSPSPGFGWSTTGTANNAAACGA